MESHGYWCMDHQRVHCVHSLQITVLSFLGRHWVWKKKKKKSKAQNLLFSISALSFLFLSPLSLYHLLQSIHLFDSTIYTYIHSLLIHKLYTTTCLQQHWQRQRPPLHQDRLECHLKQELFLIATTATEIPWKRPMLRLIFESSLIWIQVGR